MTRRTATSEGPPSSTPVPIVGLAHGRRLSVGTDAGHDVVEVRADDGALEVRIVLTPEGPLLQMEALRLRLSARDEVSIDCGSLRVTAAEGLDLAAGGDVTLTAGQALHTTSTADTRVVGRIIYLN